MPGLDIAVTVEPCVKDVDGSLVPTSVNAVRDIIVSSWSVPQNVSGNFVVGYSSFWAGMNVYNATLNPPAVTPSPPPPPPPRPAFPTIQASPPRIPEFPPPSPAAQQPPQAPIANNTPVTFKSPHPPPPPPTTKPCKRSKLQSLTKH